MNYAPFNIFNELENNKIELNVVDAKLQGRIQLVDPQRSEIQLHGSAPLREERPAPQDHRGFERRQRLSSRRQLDHPSEQPLFVAQYGGSQRRADRRTAVGRFLQHEQLPHAQLRHTLLAQLQQGLGRCPHARAERAGRYADQIHRPPHHLPRRSPATSTRWAAWSTTIPTSTA